MNKKAKVKMLLELISQLNGIPTKADGHTMDMDKFPKVPEVAAVITLLKFLKVDGEYLRKSGFVPAYMVFAQYLK